MPLFQVSSEKLAHIEQTNFAAEKMLQKLVEANLQTVFASTFVASEFSTGAVHAGRIDTLALSEESNPVIIEYKKVESSELINQSLFYLHWLKDHRGDFEQAVRKALGDGTDVDWSDIRVICLAPNFKKYDLLAVQVMGVNIELWSYRFFKNQTLYLEEVLQRSIASPTPASGAAKNPIMVAAGKKAALTKATGSYTFDQHIAGKSDEIREMAVSVEDYVLGLDAAMEEVPKKLYVAYRISKNIVCMEIQKQKILLFLKLDPKLVKGPSSIVRDVTNIGHFGTGDLEVTIKSMSDLEIAKSLIRTAYEKTGG